MEKEELRSKSAKEIEELKKDQDWLVVNKAQLWAYRVLLENVIFEVC